MIAIKHRYSDTTLCEFDVESVKQAAEKGKANLRGAYLNGADLREADLREAYLNEADLRGTYLNEANLSGALIHGEKISKNPIHITCGLQYVALITDGYMRLGCKRFTHAEWAAFSENEISAMDNGALEFWLQWKAPLLAMCDAHRGVGVVLIKE